MDGSSWANAIPGSQLQLAIDNAQPGDQLWVSCGTYYTTDGIDREIAFHMKNDVFIAGSFQGTESDLSERVFTCGACSILSGAIGDVNIDDNSYHVISNGTGLTNSAILDGFVIEDANDDRTATMTEGLGGGVYNDGGYAGNSCMPTFRNCIFRANFAQFGAGMFNSGHTGGIASPDLLNCIFIDNHAYIGGGAIDNFGLGGNASPSLTNTIIYGNVAEGRAGGMYNWAGNEGITIPKITNCVFANNTATDGGAIVSDRLNSGAGSSGNSTPNLINTILWGNSVSGAGPQFFLLGDAGLSATVSDIDLTNQTTPHVITSGTGNLSVDPLFMNSANPIGPDNCWLTEDDGLRFQASSTLIDAGTLEDAPTSDIQGNPRFSNPDLGPYEFVGHSAAVDELEANIHLFPNPAHDFILLQGMQDQAGYSLLNSLGQQIHAGKMHENKLEISQLPEGLYLLKITSGNSGKTLRFIKN